METISALLTSGETVDALESAIRALPGGNDAMDQAIAVVIANREEQPSA